VPRPFERWTGYITGLARVEGSDILGKHTTDSEIERVEPLLHRFAALLIGYFDIHGTERDTASVLDDKKGKINSITSIEFFETYLDIRGGRR
jgi:hypothetical protein